jgi:hypothetical protein
LPLLGAAWLFFAPGQSRGHALLTSPAPRDNRSDHKDPYGPCGVARTTMSTSLQSGQALTVNFTETVDHPGCFLIDLSTDNDQTWRQLGNVAHSSTGTTPRMYSAQVTLPAGVSCDSCTLRLRQIMLGSDATPCPPNPIPTGATYYSCADVKITAPTSAPDLSTPSPDLGSPGSGPGGGSQATGCSVVPGGGRAASRPAAGLTLLFALSGLAAIAARRRAR